MGPDYMPYTLFLGDRAGIIVPFVKTYATEIYEPTLMPALKFIRFIIKRKFKDK